MSVKLNLNLDSFRAMIGANSYGEVRLAQNGGLEKINHHFAQRKWGIGVAKTSSYENQAIRLAFMNSLSGKVLSETLKRVADKLGLVQVNSEASQKPLSRRTIKEVIDMVDAERASETANDSFAKLFAKDKDGVSLLKTAISAYNRTKPKVGPISLSSTELGIVLNRHRADFQLAVAGKPGDKANEAVIELLRDIQGREDVREGDSKLSQSVAPNVSTDYTKEQDTYYTTARLISDFAFDERLFERDDDLKGGHTGALKNRFFPQQNQKPFAFNGSYFNHADWGTVPQENLGPGKLARYTQIRTGKEQPLFASNELSDFAVDLISDCGTSSYFNNMGRNAFERLTFEGQDKLGHLKSDQKNLDAVMPNNFLVMKNLMTSVARQCPKIDGRQFVAVLRMFNQTVYNLPGALFGQKNSMPVAGVNVKIYGDDVKVSMCWRDKNATEATLKMDYTIHPQGICKVDYLGPVGGGSAPSVEESA